MSSVVISTMPIIHILILLSWNASGSKIYVTFDSVTLLLRTYLKEKIRSVAKDLCLKLQIAALFMLVKKSNILMVEYKQFLKIISQIISMT